MSWGDELAELLAAAPCVPPVSEQVLQLGAHLDAEHPGAGWTLMLALTHRLLFEHRGACVACITHLCLANGWIVEEEDGPLPHPRHDGEMRRYSLTDMGRAAAMEVMPC